MTDYEMLLNAINKIEYENKLSRLQIAEKLGYNYTYLSGVLNGKVPLSKRFTDKLCEEFHICIGESEKSSEYAELIDTEELYKKAINAGLQMLPEIDFEFSGGSTQLISDNNKISKYWYLPDCEDCEAVATMVGNSMLPMLPPGCHLVLKRYGFDINKPNSIAFGSVYGIVVEDPITGQWHGHVKILKRHKDPEFAKQFWIAHSLNENFDDFDIEIALVRGLWIVKQHIVMNMIL